MDRTVTTQTRISLDRLPAAHTLKHGARVYSATGEAMKFVRPSTSTPGSIFVMPCVEGADHSNMRSLHSAQLFVELPAGELAAMAVKPATPATPALTPPSALEMAPIGTITTSARPASVPHRSLPIAAPTPPTPSKLATVRTVARPTGNVTAAPSAALSAADHVARRDAAVMTAHVIAQRLATLHAEAAAAGRPLTVSAALQILRARGQVPPAQGSR